jgi:hypothetical protein
MTPEGSAAQKVRVRATAWFCRLFRNNSGVLPSIDSNRPVRFGLGNESKELNREMKSHDYIGFTPIVITQDMVGNKVAVFTSVETKAEGFEVKKKYSKKSREQAQNNWSILIRENGGIAGFASTPDQFDSIMQEFHTRVRTL